MSDILEYEASLSKYPWLLEKFKNNIEEKKINTKVQYEFFIKICKYIDKEWIYTVRKFSERKTMPTGFRIRDNILTYKNKRIINSYTIEDPSIDNAESFIEFLKLCRVSYEESSEEKEREIILFENLSEVKSPKMCLILIEEFVCRKSSEYNFDKNTENRLITILYLMYHTKQLKTENVKLENNIIKNIDQIHFDYDMRTFIYKKPHNNQSLNVSLTTSSGDFGIFSYSNYSNSSISVDI